MSDDRPDADDVTEPAGPGDRGVEDAGPDVAGGDETEAAVVVDEEGLVARIVDTITPDSSVTRIEFFTTVVLAVAGVLTAWAALQSSKWSGDQAIHFSEAGANRTESTRFDNRATSTILLDTSTFFSWGEALQTEEIAAEAAGTTAPDPTAFDPSNPSLSGYFFSLFREEFQPRVTRWLEGGGPQNPEGSSPFDPFEAYLDESVPAAAEAERLELVADESAALARQDNQNSDDYVLTVVILAAVLFFAGISSKMKSKPNQYIMFGLSVIMLAWAITRLVTLPIHTIP